MFQIKINRISSKVSFFARKFPLSLLIAVISFNFVVPPQYIYAQSTVPSVLGLPAPGAMLAPTQMYEPPLIKGMTVHPENPLLFDFIVESGDSNVRGPALNQEGLRMVEYFLASLTIPDDEMWVNLSPYEKDRIISEGLGLTSMGRDLLAQDYILKQMTASLLYPENELGKRFWDKVYKTAYERFGTTHIPIETFNKVWIVPRRAAVYEQGNSVFVVSRDLKVMLEEDYLSWQTSLKGKGKTAATVGEHAAEANDVSSQIIREIIIPELEKEVNEGKYFAELRQIYNAMILAKWYKENLRETLLGKVYIDQNKVKGVDVADREIKEKIYQQYLEAFKVGAYNFIKEEHDIGEKAVIPRKYFSGGMRGLADINLERSSSPVNLDPAQRSQLPSKDSAVKITVALVDIGVRAAASPVTEQDQIPSRIFGSLIPVGADAKWLLEKFKTAAFSILDLSEEITAIALADSALRGKGGLGHLTGDENADSNKMKKTANAMITNAYKHIWNAKTERWDPIQLDQIENLHPLMVEEDGTEKQLEYIVSFKGNNHVGPIGRDYKVKIYYVNNDGNLLLIQSVEDGDLFHHLYDDFSNNERRWVQYGFQARSYVEFMKRVGGAPDVLYLNEGHMTFVYAAIRNDIEWHRVRGKTSIFEGIKIVFKNHTPEWAGIPKMSEHEIARLRSLVGEDLVQGYMLTDGHFNSLEAMIQNALYADLAQTGVELSVSGVSAEHEEVIAAVLLKRFPDAHKVLTHIQNGSRAVDWQSERVKAAIAEHGVAGVTGEMLLEILEADKLDANKDLRAMYGTITRESMAEIGLDFDRIVAKLNETGYYDQNGRVNPDFNFEEFEQDQEFKDEITGEKFWKLIRLLQRDLAVPQFDEALLAKRPVLGFLRRWVEYKEAGVLLSMIKWITGDRNKQYEHPVIHDLLVLEDPARVDELEEILANPQWTTGLGLEVLVAAGGESQGEPKGKEWLQWFKGLSAGELKGRLVVVEDAGMPIMKWITRITVFGYNVPDPTREASGTSQQRWGFLGRLVLAIDRAGMSAQIKHRVGGWLLKVFPKKTQAELMEDFDPEVDGGRRIMESREQFRRRVPVLVAAYLTEAVDLYYNNRGELANRMLKAFRTAIDTVDTERMVREKEALAVSMVNGTSVQGFEGMRKAMYEQDLLVKFYRWNPGLKEQGVDLETVRNGISEFWSPLDDIILGEERHEDLFMMPNGEFEAFLEQNGLQKGAGELWAPVAEGFQPNYLDMGAPAAASSPVTDTVMKNVGGIDLNPSLFDLQIKRDEQGVPLPLPMQPIQNMNIDGFLPVIINVTPVTDLPILIQVN